MLRPAGFSESFRSWRRQLGPVSLYFKNGVATPIPFTVAIVAGPGYSAADPTTATSPQSDQIVIFTVTFSLKPNFSMGVVDTTDWVVTNGTLLQANPIGTLHPLTPSGFLVSVHATATGDVTLSVPAASNTSVLGSTNSASNIPTVTFTPDNPTTTRRVFFANNTAGSPAAMGSVSVGNEGQATFYWEPRVDLDLTTIPSVTSADMTTATNCSFGSAGAGSGVWAGARPSMAGNLSFSGVAPFTATAGFRDGASGSPLRTVFGGEFDGTASASISITP